MSNAAQFQAKLDAWSRLLERAGRAPGRNTMAGIGDQITTSTVERMEDQVDVDGKPLAPLSDEWIRFKKYGTRSELIAEGRAIRLALADDAKARQSVLRKWRRGKGPAGRRGGYSDKIWQYTGESKRRTVVTRATAKAVVCVINTAYSGYVQKGTEHMPPRPVLGMSAEDRRIVTRILEQGIADALAGRGGSGA